MTDGTDTRGASTPWIMLLTLASGATTLVLACATPYPALAALAATHMRRRDGIALMLAAWVLAQATGFCLLGYPRDATTLAWAPALGTAAVASLLAARAAAARGRGDVGRLLLAYAAAAVAFKLVVLGWSFGLGGVETALSPAIFARQFVRNGAILAGLLVLHRIVAALGLPLPAGQGARAWR